MNESLDKLNQMWHKWNSHSVMSQEQRFGQYVLNNAGLHMAQPDIYYETNAQLAYQKLYLVISDGTITLQ